MCRKVILADASCLNNTHVNENWALSASPLPADYVVIESWIETWLVEVVLLVL